jgi:hypothetical protein
MAYRFASIGNGAMGRFITKTISPLSSKIFQTTKASDAMRSSASYLLEHDRRITTMSNTRFTTEREGTFFKALDRCHTATSGAAYTRFSNYANYRIALQTASPDFEPCPCSWHDAGEMCALLSGAALEWCGSLHHQGTTVKLFSQIGVSYWASKFAIEHLSQFESYLQRKHDENTTRQTEAADRYSH